MITVPSARAERSCRLLMQTLGAYLSQAPTLAAGSRMRLPRAGNNKLEIAQQASIIRLASITESFCADALIAAAERLGRPGSSTTMQAIWEESVINATRTWAAQQKAYKDWLDVRIKWTAVDDLATARNAIAHGLGSLTRQQQRSHVAVKAQLSRVDITLNGLDLVLTDQSVRGLALKCRTFILELDAAIEARLQKP